MPPKSQRCPKCGGRTRQKKFLIDKPVKVFDNFGRVVVHGRAIRKCVYCNHEFEGNGWVREQTYQILSSDLSRSKKEC